MRRSIRKILLSFKFRILFSYFVLISILLIWIGVYIFMNNKQRRLNLFTFHLTQLQDHYFESDRHLEHFVLTGFHEAPFYATGRQMDIDLFLEEQNNAINNLDELKTEAGKEHVAINDKLDKLIGLHKALADSVAQLKGLYLKKGFNVYGTEGLVHRYAHLLEDSFKISKVDILMLRRREKDFLLREDPKYATEFDQIIDKDIKVYAGSPGALKTLINYRNAFSDLVNCVHRIGISDRHGLYGNIQYTINQLDAQYLSANTSVTKMTTGLGTSFKKVLIDISIILLLLVVALSIILSDILTHGIKKLNKNIRLFIRSRFKEDGPEFDKLISGITEVEWLNKNFRLLRQTLRHTLTDLENSVNEEKKVSADLAATVAKLSVHMEEIEHQKRQIEKSEAKLNAFFNSATSCHIMVGGDLSVITFNRAAVTFIHDLFGKELRKGIHVLYFLNEEYIDRFIDDYQKALAGEFIREERLFTYPSGHGLWWEVSFVPAVDSSGKIFAVSFNATNINETKTHSNKIREQHDILLKIAHIQSHEIRGPVATMMGIMNIIRDEENFCAEYLAMLEEVAHAIDKRIHEIVDYTKQVS